MNQQQWIEKSEHLMMPTYSRFPAVMVEGEGCVVKDAQGKAYLDFLSGIAVCSLGHNFPPVTRAICDQAAQLNHISNLFYSTPQITLAELLVQNSFADRIFFANSGAEANEAAIKLARKYATPERYEIITLEKSFHGRTLATIAATGQPHFHQGFEPMPAGFVHVPFGDPAALEQAISEKTCAILCEPLQGEGGVRPLPDAYIQTVRKLCDQYDLLLIFDEVQVGMGRTGSLFAYEQLGITPDIMTLAKALGNGLPIGATLATDKIAAAFTPGSHASTFGGNPIACAAAIATINTMLQKDFLDNVQKKGRYLSTGLTRLTEKYPSVAQSVRGMGLIQGLVLTPAARPHGANIVNALFHHGILANFAGNTALRFIPPLIISRAEIDQMLTILEPVLASLKI